MANNHPAVTPNIEEKAEIAQHELHRDASPEVAMKAGDAFDEADARGQQESGFESLTAWQTIKTFKRASVYCFLVTFAAATDGYQVCGRFRIPPDLRLSGRLENLSQCADQLP